MSIDFSKMNHVTADEIKIIGKSRSGSFSVSMVNNRNGKRFTLSKALHEFLGSPKRLQFVADGKYLYIGATIPHSTEFVTFSKGVGTTIIYDAGFVEYISRTFDLDYSNRTSISFSEIKIETHEHENEQITYARIKMVNDD